MRKRIHSDDPNTVCCKHKTKSNTPLCNAAANDIPSININKSKQKGEKNSIWNVKVQFNPPSRCRASLTQSESIMPKFNQRERCE